MNKFGFYVMGEKGYECISGFIDAFGSSSIAFVTSSHDLNVKQDFYDAICLVCERYSIPFSNRSHAGEIKADYVFAIGWRWLINESDNLIVFHDSLLPKYRGFSPLVNALIDGRSEVGVTALKASAEYDAGPIIGQELLKIEYPAKIRDVIERISVLYVRLLVDVCEKLMNDLPLISFSQDQLNASYSPWRNEGDYLINWGLSSNKIMRFVDAVGHPYSGARTRMSSKYVRIDDVELAVNVDIEDREAHLGKVLFMDKNKPVVICGTGLIKIVSIFDANGVSLEGKIPFRTKFGG